MRLSFLFVLPLPFPTELWVLVPFYWWKEMRGADTLCTVTDGLCLVIVYLQNALIWYIYMAKMVFVCTHGKSEITVPYRD